MNHIELAKQILECQKLAIEIQKENPTWTYFDAFEEAKRRLKK